MDGILIIPTLEVPPYKHFLNADSQRAHFIKSVFHVHHDGAGSHQASFSNFLTKIYQTVTFASAIAFLQPNREYMQPLFYAPFVLCVFLMPLAIIHHFLTYALSFSV